MTLEQIADKMFELETICNDATKTAEERNIAEEQVSNLTQYIITTWGINGLLELDQFIQKKFQELFDSQNIL